MENNQSTQTSINVKTRDETVFEAARDVAIHLGWKAQWSHMRTLIIGEALAKKRNIGEVLDFFGRDHEPRSNISIMIGKNRGDAYLNIKPFIEQNIGQQLREAENKTYRFTGKTLETSFLDLMLQLKGETGVAVVPYLYFDPKNKPATTPVTGLALLKKGKMAGIVPSKRIESPLMLMNKYEGGVIETACPKQHEEKIKKQESLEVESAPTDVTVKAGKDTTEVNIAVELKVYAGELLCTSLKTTSDVEKFNEIIQKAVEKDLHRTIKLLQKKKFDVIGIGTRINYQNPALWKQLKPEWAENFARFPFSVNVEVNIFNTGANIGIPLAE